MQYSISRTISPGPLPLPTSTCRRLAHAHTIKASYAQTLAFLQHTLAVPHSLQDKDQKHSITGGKTRPHTYPVELPGTTACRSPTP